MVSMTIDSSANVVSELRINNLQRLPCFEHRWWLQLLPTAGGKKGTTFWGTTTLESPWTQSQQPKSTDTLSQHGKMVKQKAFWTTWNTKCTEDGVDELLSPGSLLDSRFKNHYNDDDIIKLVNLCCLSVQLCLAVIYLLISATLSTGSSSDRSCSAPLPPWVSAFWSIH